MDIIVCYLIGFAMWYFYYMLELFINGATLGYEGKICLMPFKFAWMEFTWLLPGGLKKKYEHVGKDIEWLLMMPGFYYFFFTHIFLPLVPLLLYLAFTKTWSCF